MKGKHSRSARRDSNLLLCRRPTDNANIANSVDLDVCFPSELQHALIGPWGTHVGTRQSEEVLEMGRMENTCLVCSNLDTLGLEPRLFCMRSGCTTTTAKTQMGRGESGWCSDMTSTHGVWRHTGVRFLLLGDFKTSCGPTRA